MSIYSDLDLGTIYSDRDDRDTDASAHIRNTRSGKYKFFPTFRAWASKLSRYSSAWFQMHPRVMRKVFCLLRRVGPFTLQPPRWLRGIRSFPRVTVVPHYEDVLQVYARDVDFTLAHLNASAMPGGPLILGMDRGDRWEKERGELGDALPGTAHVVELAKNKADEIIDRVLSSGTEQLDVVNDLAVPLSLEIAREFFGVREVERPSAARSTTAGNRETEDQRLYRWFEELALPIVCAAKGDPDVRKPGNRAGNDLSEHIDALINGYRWALSHGLVGDNVLARLLKATDDRDLTMRSVIGMVVAGTPTVVKAATQASYQLLRHREAFERAVRVVDDAPEALDGFVREALRFHPVFPMLVRYAPRGTGLVSSSGKRCGIPANSKVLIFPLSAMFDMDRDDAPTCFDETRDESRYLHFSSGIHRCLGDEVAHIEIREIMRALLRLPNLRLAGRIHYQDVLVKELLVSFSNS